MIQFGILLLMSVTAYTSVIYLIFRHWLNVKRGKEWQWVVEQLNKEHSMLKRGK